ncbi:hypothetical protein AAVH_18185 [Aphelenchoides avenae]|nr:hypothetical protein AAVH_18185 [Aphelenchus avenae]
MSSNGPRSYAEAVKSPPQNSPMQATQRASSNNGGRSAVPAPLTPPSNTAEHQPSISRHPHREHHADRTAPNTPETSMRNAPKRAAAVAALTKLTSRPATVKQEHMDTEEGPPTAKRNRRDSLLNADQPLMLDYGKAIFADASHYILLYPSKRHPGEHRLDMNELIVKDGRLLTNPEVINAVGRGHYCLEGLLVHPRASSAPPETAPPVINVTQHSAGTTTNAPAQAQGLLLRQPPLQVIPATNPAGVVPANSVLDTATHTPNATHAAEARVLTPAPTATSSSSDGGQRGDNASAPSERGSLTVRYSPSERGMVLQATHTSAQMTFGEFRRMFNIPQSSRKGFSFKRTETEWEVIRDEDAALPAINGQVEVRVTQHPAGTTTNAPAPVTSRAVGPPSATAAPPPTTSAVSLTNSVLPMAYFGDAIYDRPTDPSSFTYKSDLYGQFKFVLLDTVEKVQDGRPSVVRLYVCDACKKLSQTHTYKDQVVHAITTFGQRIVKHDPDFPRGIPHLCVRHQRTTSRLPDARNSLS